MLARVRGRLRSWDGLLLGLVLLVVLFNVVAVPGYVGFQNQVNLWQNGIEKAIVVLAMAFVIINGEIDLSVASMMGLSSVVVATLWDQGIPIELAILAALAVGLGLGLMNGFWVAIVGLPSLAVTLAGLIGFRGLAFILIEDRSVGNDASAFPRWFEELGQQPLYEPVLGPITLAMIVYFGLLALAATTLGAAGYGRRTYVIGASSPVARLSGVNVVRHKVTIFMLSGFIGALAGVLYAAHLGAVRGSTATGFELDIITIVLLGGVSIFGGSGTMLGVFLSTVLVLNIRNGLGLLNVPGHTQTGFVGVLLILSVLVPNLLIRYQTWSRRRTLAHASHDARDGPVASAGRG